SENLLLLSSTRSFAVFSPLFAPCSHEWPMPVCLSKYATYPTHTHPLSLHDARPIFTEKLMDELAQCYNVLPQLDINNTIDHRPEGDEKWFLENEKTVTQFCRKLAAERPLKDIRDEYNYPKKKGIKDESSRLLEASTMKSRRGFAIQRVMNAMRQAHADGWFIVFDTLTLADDRLEAFYDTPNALRDYFRDIGRMVLAAECRKANDSHADCYQYFCVPEYGTANGRLHFHAVHFMRTLPTGSVDPNFGRRVRNRRQLNSLQNTWPYGYSMP